jgi:hypothetical protein
MSILPGRRPRQLVAATCLSLCVAFLPAVVLAQPSPRVEDRIDDVLKTRWASLLKEVAALRGLSVEGNHLSGSKEVKKAAYEEIVDRLQRDPAILALVYPDPKDPRYQQLVQEKVRDEDRKFIESLREAGGAGPSGTSVNSRSTNPVAGALTERSGLSQLIALALDGRNGVSANDSAVSLNLGALALISLADPDVYSELYRYQQHAFLRRLNGTFVFGAKVPEKEITGLSSLPDFDKLLDVFVWDVKVRVWGNRDIRDPRWYPLTLGRGGLQSQMATTIGSLDMPTEDFELLQPMLERVIDPSAIKRRVSRAPQLTAKVSGTHLTKETGKNKYSGGLLFDTGLGRADLTANLLYSVTDDVSLGPSNVFQVKQWTANAAITGHLAKDALVKGSAIDWSGGFAATVFANKGSLPVPADNTWKVFTTFEIPLNAAARIPFAVVYTNDQNALQKTQYVSGHVGISYDFSALTKLFGGKP